MPSLTIDVTGDYDDVQFNHAMTILGELIINRIKQFIRELDLVVTSDYLQGWFSNWDGNVLTIENRTEYSLYLEYGTYGYFEKNGEDNITDPSDPKKRDMSSEMKKTFPKGMQSFAPIRRVLYNQAIMQELVGVAFANA